MVKLVIFDCSFHMGVHVLTKYILARFKMALEFLIGLKQATTTITGKALTELTRVFNEHQMVFKYCKPHDFLELAATASTAVGICSTVRLLETIYPNSYFIFFLKPLQVPEVQTFVFRKLCL